MSRTKVGLDNTHERAGQATVRRLEDTMQRLGAGSLGWGQGQDRSKGSEPIGEALMSPRGCCSGSDLGECRVRTKVWSKIGAYVGEGVFMHRGERMGGRSVCMYG